VLEGLGVTLGYPLFDGRFETRHNPRGECVMRHRKRFTRAFKLEAVRLLEQGVAKESSLFLTKSHF